MRPAYDVKLRRTCRVAVPPPHGLPGIVDHTGPSAPTVGFGGRDRGSACVRELRRPRDREEALRQLHVQRETRRARADQVEVDVVVDVLARASDVLEALHVDLLPRVLGDGQDPLGQGVDRDTCRKAPGDALRMSARVTPGLDRVRGGCVAERFAGAVEPAAAVDQSRERCRRASAGTAPSVVARKSIEPAAIEPAAMEPAAMEPAAIEPAAIEPAAIEPTAVVPRLPEIARPKTVFVAA